MKKIYFMLSALMALTFVSCDKDDAPATPPADTVVKTEVNSVGDAASALTGGNQELTVKGQVSGTSNEITLPNSYSGNETVTIILKEVAAGAEVSFSEAPGATATSTPKTLFVEIPTGNKVTIDMPNTTVVLSGQTLENVEAATAESTLIVEAGTTINNLTVNKGSVRILGIVNNCTLAEGNTTSRIFWNAGTEAGLRAVLAKDALINHGVILTADIACTTLDVNNGAQENQDGFIVGKLMDDNTDNPYNKYVVEGEGHTLSGAAYNNVMAVYADEVVINNLKIAQTTADTTRKKNAGISLYRSKGITLNNVTVTGCGKAGVIVNSSTVTAVNLTTSGNKWGGVNVAKGTSPAGGAKPEFTLVSGNLAETTPIYVDGAAVSDYTVNTPAGENWISTPFNDGAIIVYTKQQ